MPNAWTITNGFLAVIEVGATIIMYWIMQQMKVQLLQLVQLVERIEDETNNQPAPRIRP